MISFLPNSETVQNVSANNNKHEVVPTTGGETLHTMYFFLFMYICEPCTRFCVQHQFFFVFVVVR